ncbi:MAG: NosD domain-containing protein [Thermoplasmatales archaeon]|nr:NosD domain-containing protein [Thermoplasmatales archaeon]
MMATKKITLTLMVILILMFLCVSVEASNRDEVSKATPVTIYVDDNFIDEPENHKWNTIQEGIDDANESDTVFVYSGIYNESIVINKAINLTGEDRKTTVIDGNGARDVVYVSADRVNITGFTVKNGSKGISFFSSSNSSITNSAIHNASDNGVFFSSSSNNTVTNCTVYNNSYGVYLSSSSDNIIIYCNVTDNTVCGVYIYYYMGHPSNYNIFHHNNFINNNQNAYDPHINYWDDSIAGNYWSDYNGTDVDADGLGDASYNISGGDNKDNYPLIEHVGTDTIKPKITVTGVENNTYYNANVTPMITIFDINPNITTVTLNSVDFTSGTMISEDGGYTLFVQGTDKAGNSAEETITFTIDKILPTINLTSPANNSVIKPGTNIDFGIVDIHLSTTTRTVNDGEAQQFSSPYSINTEDWGDGTYNITIRADDLAGNENYTTFRFIIDGTPPEINIAGAANGSYYNTNVTLTIDISDAHLDEDETIITLDNASFVSGTEVSSEGEHTLYVYAVDKAENNASQTIIFIIDKTPPTIKISEKNQTTTRSSFTLHWYSSEPIQYYEVSVDGEKWINISTNTYCTFTLSKGANTFYVKGKDLAGNTNTASVTIEKVEEKEEKIGYFIYLIIIPSVFAAALIAVIAFLKRKIRIRCPACKTVFNVKPRKRPFKTECPKCGREGTLR